MTRTDAFYAALVVSALLVNAAGYLLSLWHEETLFDEIVHFYTSFAVVGTIGWLALRGAAPRRSPPTWWILVAVGVLLGLAWEAVEWVLGIIGSGHDTMMDLAMDAAGAAAAAALLSYVAGHRASR
ncbi:MAG: hypothetical protein H0W39_09605 [Sphingomonas sp.]|nr:hypothetical protein [Sphingomonas sp.]